MGIRQKAVEKEATTAVAPRADPEEVLAWLRRQGRQRVRDGMARYGLPSEHAVGVSVGALKQHAKRLGRSHDLALALWASGIYEARLLAAFVDDPALVTPAQMDRWCRDFDNWGVVDTVCFALFDRTPHAWRKVGQWSRRRDEFGKRAAFALLASLAGHDRSAGDGDFLRTLPLIEAAATDHRNFVKKGVSWALRSIGGRSAGLHAAALELSRRLAASPDATARWLGKEASRDLERPVVARRLARRASSRAGRVE